MTEIRSLRQEELQQLSRLHTVVYNGRRDFSKEEEKRDPLSWPAEWSWGFFENGKLISGMWEIRYLMSFDGNTVPMSGIGGVGTLPEARKGGLVKSIFQRLFKEAYERGVVFSCLAPFSYNYYRQYGYDISCARNRITVPLREFSHLRLKGRFTQIFPGDDFSSLAKVHKQYIEKVNHGIARDFWPENLAWRIFTKNDPYSTGQFIYLWQDDASEARGYVKYEVQRKPDEVIISISELAFTDREALHGVLSMFGVLGAQINKLQWLMPSFIDPFDFVRADSEMEQKIIHRDMTRVINVKAALEKMRRPAGEGAYIIEVDDKFIPENKGRFLVEYGPEGTRVSPSQKDPDMRCEIPELSQLITGYRTLENLLFSRHEGLEVYKNRETLDRVFTQRPQHMTEYF